MQFLSPDGYNLSGGVTWAIQPVGESIIDGAPALDIDLRSAPLEVPIVGLLDGDFSITLAVKLHEGINARHTGMIGRHSDMSDCTEGLKVMP